MLSVTRAQSSSNVKSATLPQVRGAVNFLVPSTCMVLGPGLHSVSSVCEIIQTTHWLGCSTWLLLTAKTAFPVNQPCYTCWKVLLIFMQYIKQEKECFITFSTPRRELKKRRATEFFKRTSRCLEMRQTDISSVLYTPPYTTLRMSLRALW